MPGTSRLLLGTPSLGGGHASLLLNENSAIDSGEQEWASGYLEKRSESWGPVSTRLLSSWLTFDTDFGRNWVLGGIPELCFPPWLGCACAEPWEHSPTWAGALINAQLWSMAWEKWSWLLWPGSFPHLGCIPESQMLSCSFHLFLLFLWSWLLPSKKRFHGFQMLPLNVALLTFFFCYGFE